MPKVIRFLLWVLMVALLVTAIVGGTLYYGWHTAEADPGTPPQVTLGGQALAPESAVWNAPVYGGALYRTEHLAYSIDAAPLAPLATAGAAFVAPGGYSVSLTVEDAAAQTVYTGSGAAQTVTFTANGTYTVRATLTKEKQPGQPYGTLSYKSTLTVDVRPVLQLSATRIDQGGIVAVRLSGMVDTSVVPTIDTQLSRTQFSPIQNGYIAYIGISYNREAGDWPVTVTCGDAVWNETVTVLYQPFQKEYTAPDGSGSAAADKEWRDAIWPLYDTADAEQYWTGRWKKPLEAPLLSTFGAFLYTEGSTSPSRHGGIDYSAAQGTPVTNPARGRVVFARQLQLTGGTVVLEHGNGVKSFFYHLNDITCSVGDMLEQGAQVGLVGQTGGVAQPMLHYEVKIGNQSVDPTALFNGSAGLYFTGR